MKRAALSILIAVGLLSTIPPAGAADWTQFRGPEGHGISQETDVPLSEDAVGIAVGDRKKEFSAVRPEGDWYLSIGQGMGKTITVATEKEAYTLADRGTYYAFAMAQPPRVATGSAVPCAWMRH